MDNHVESEEEITFSFNARSLSLAQDRSCHDLMGLLLLLRVGVGGTIKQHDFWDV